MSSPISACFGWKLCNGIYLPKKDLVDGQWYKGFCRNATVAQWSATHIHPGNEWHPKRVVGMFFYWRTKFGNTFIENIYHPEDDDGFDLFFPTEGLPDKMEDIRRSIGDQS